MSCVRLTWALNFVAWRSRYAERPFAVDYLFKIRPMHVSHFKVRSITECNIALRDGSVCFSVIYHYEISQSATLAAWRQTSGWKICWLTVTLNAAPSQSTNNFRHYEICLLVAIHFLLRSDFDGIRWQTQRRKIQSSRHKTALNMRTPKKKGIEWDDFGSTNKNIEWGHLPSCCQCALLRYHVGKYYSEIPKRCHLVVRYCTLR